MWLFAGMIACCIAGTVWLLAFATGVVLGRPDYWDLLVSLGYYALFFICGWGYIKESMQ